MPRKSAVMGLKLVRSARSPRTDLPYAFPCCSSSHHQDAFPGGDLKVAPGEGYIYSLSMALDLP